VIFAVLQALAFWFLLYYTSKKGRRSNMKHIQIKKAGMEVPAVVVGL